MGTRSWLALFASLLVSAIGSSQTTAVPTLRILNWSEYIDVDERPPAITAAEWAKKPMVERSPTLRAFAKENGCAIDYVEYDANDQMHQLLASQSASFDLVVMTDDQVVASKKGGLLSTLDHELIPNLKNLHPSARAAFDPESSVSVPYLVGTSGILYRCDLVADIKSWAELFETKNERLKGKVALLDDASVVVTAALKAVGASANSSDVGELRRANRLLQAFKNAGFVGQLTSDVEFVTQALHDGRFLAYVCYSGDGISAAHEDPTHLKFVVPSEGSVWYVDTMVIPQGAPHAALAHRFVDFILRPEIHGRLAAALNYQCPNAPARALLPPEHLQNPWIYPAPEMMARMEPFRLTDVTARERILHVLR